MYFRNKQWSLVAGVVRDNPGNLGDPTPQRRPGRPKGSKDGPRAPSAPKRGRQPKNIPAPSPGSGNLDTVSDDAPVAGE